MVSPPFGFCGFQVILNCRKEVRIFTQEMLERPTMLGGELGAGIGGGFWFRNSNC